MPSYRRARVNPAAVPAILLPDPPPPPWRGRSILFRRLTGGGVAATSRGRVAVGRDETEALYRLWELLYALPPEAGRIG